MAQQSSPLKIDIDSVLRARLPRHYRFIPRFMVSAIERMIHQADMNTMLEVNQGKTGADFCRGVLDHLNITYSTIGAERLPANPRCIFVCNHPLGGLDGMMLIDFVTRHYGVPVKFLVNDLLMAIEPLSDVFLPINKHGTQSRQSSVLIDQAMESDAPIIIFPAGLVSRKGNDGIIADLQWQKAFVSKAIKFQRDVIPTFFSGENSNFFYNFANIRKRLGIKLNIEMVRLPAEVFRSRNRSYTISFGNPISFASLKGGPNARQEADSIRRAAYALKPTRP